MKTRDEDFVEHLFIASTHAYILIFTNKGRVYWLKVYEIPDVSAAGKGKHVGNLIGLQPGESVKTMLAVRQSNQVFDGLSLARGPGNGSLIHLSPLESPPVCDNPKLSVRPGHG